MQDFIGIIYDEYLISRNMNTIIFKEIIYVYKDINYCMFFFVCYYENTSGPFIGARSSYISKIIQTPYKLMQVSMYVTKYQLEHVM